MFSINGISQFLFGAKVKAELPQYVQKALNEQQSNSEKLISWMLWLLISFVMVLYCVAPLPEESGHHDTVLLVALISYFTFAILRIFLAYIKRLPEWILILSAIFDVLILMTLVWSIHIVYHAPPVFYLKIPFISYIYILLAIRVLRYDPKYVVIVGATAISCYSFLLYYALAYSPAGTHSRDYAEYILGSHIFLPGEINKIIVIFLVTVILTLALVRARRLMVRAIAETRAVKELSRFFDPDIATNIIDSMEDLQPGQGKQCHAAIIYCDIRGFTEFSKKISPSELMELLIQYQAIIVKAVKPYHGSIDKFLGDGILISFNAIVPHPQTYAADALNAALQISKANQRWQKKRKKAGMHEIHIGISIASGYVTVGVVGHMTRLEYTVIGDPVNLSAKLDKHCKTEHCEVLTTSETYHLALQQGFKFAKKIEQRSKVKVSGIKEAMNLVILKKE